MGEFALYGEDRVKIGTCENMYYLRADQARLVRATEGSVDPVADASALRFRFPWPDEDDVLPGAFGPYDRSADLSMDPPADVEHERMQFTAHGGGYLVSLPCPHSADAKALDHRVHRNGGPGPVQIRQQKCLDGVRMLVCRCGACGTDWRVTTLDDARPYITACIAAAEERERTARYAARQADQDPERAAAGAGEWWREVARRIEAGYVPGAGDLGPAPMPSPPPPPPPPAVAPANTNASRHVTVLDACKAIRVALLARSGKAWSVSHGRGTAYGWIDIQSPPRRRVGGYMSGADRAELAVLLGVDDVHHQGVSVSPDAREAYVARAEGRS